MLWYVGGGYYRELVKITNSDPYYYYYVFILINIGFWKG